jgi:cytosine/adenosine deaminase-related metal-dependent hydrolase
MDSKSQYGLVGATVVTPTDVLHDVDLTICGGRIVRLKRPQDSYLVDLSGYVVFPGLINAHDHLNGTWWPRVGPHRPYTNVYQWLDDLHSSPERYDRQRNSVDDIYELGMYRNLLSGVTTVADHLWRINGAEFYTRFPIDILFEYGRTWTPREPTAWGDDIPTEYSRAVRTGTPYIIHLAEGVDPETAREMDVLLQASALGRNTLIVHGVSLQPDDMHAMASVGASVCWCPTSNLFLYEHTADISALVQAGVNVTLGTDSSLSGGIDLLDELRTARRVLYDQFFEPPAGRTPAGGTPAGSPSIAQWLVESVTIRAAYALLREDRCGRIAPGYRADLLVLPDSGQDPYSSLIETQVSDIALLCRGGRPIYGDPVFRPLFERLAPHFGPTLISETTCASVEPRTRAKLVAGDPANLLDRLSKGAGRAVEFPFLPIRATPQHSSPGMQVDDLCGASCPSPDKSN